MSFRNKKNSGDNSGEGRETEGEKQRKVMRLRNLLCISVEMQLLGGFHLVILLLIGSLMSDCPLKLTNNVDWKVPCTQSTPYCCP